MKNALLLLVLAAPALAQQPAAEPGPKPPTVLEQIRAEAAALQPLVKTDFARQFLQAADELPAIAPRKLFADADRSHWYTAQQAEALPEEARAKLTPRDFDESFYWNTRYGSPVAYARALDLAAERGLPKHAALVDFGCGGLGAPRLLASLGCNALGVDVDPLLPALYSEPGDTGTIAAAVPYGRDGTLHLVTGQWPADAATVAAVQAAAPGGLDLFLSKNTLKRGYVHPERETDPRRLVHLGVDDAAFVAAVVQSLKPGGLFVIYNLCPAPAPPDKPYIPYANGRCPFERSVLEAAGLQVLDFDVVDDESIRQHAHALGWDAGEGAMDLQKDLFAWYTIARRPAAADSPK